MQPAPRFYGAHRTLPSGLPWDQKVAQAEAQWRKTQRNTAAPAVVYQNRSAQPAEPGKKQFCDWLDECVKALDSMGRAVSQSVSQYCYLDLIS